MLSRKKLHGDEAPEKRRQGSSVTPADSKVPLVSSTRSTRLRSSNPAARRLPPDKRFISMVAGPNPFGREFRRMPALYGQSPPSGGSGTLPGLLLLVPPLLAVAVVEDLAAAAADVALTHELSGERIGMLRL